MTTQGGLFSLRRAPQGMLNAILHFQSTKNTEMLEGLVEVIYKVWMDVAIKGRTPRERLLQKLVTAAERLEER